jgi:hypothetical protein
MDGDAERRSATRFESRNNRNAVMRDETLLHWDRGYLNFKSSKKKVGKEIEGYVGGWNEVGYILASLMRALYEGTYNLAAMDAEYGAALLTRKEPLLKSL